VEREGSHSITVKLVHLSAASILSTSVMQWTAQGACEAEAINLPRNDLTMRRQAGIFEAAGAVLLPGKTRKAIAVDATEHYVSPESHSGGPAMPNLTTNPSETPPEADDEQELAISSEKVFFIIVKAREFDVKEGDSDPDSGSNPSDDGDVDVLEAHGDDPVEQELRSFINALSIDEQIDLVALTWLGREDYTAADWSFVREEATRAHNNKTASYLLGIPLLGDFLEEGLSLLGYSLEEFESGRL
jgi:hypothetical protein